MTFEHDAEFVHGEIVERSMPDNIHSTIQLLILLRLGALMKQCPIFPRPELRLKLAEGLYRIPDISVFAGEPPRQNVPECPPHVVVEIISKDDRHFDLMQKLEEYRVWGVPHIWVVDPMTKQFSVHTERGLQKVSSLSLPDYPFQLTPADLFSEL